MKIELDDIRVVRGGRTIIDGLGLTVPEGAFASILGPSGAGKSTLLGVVAGLLVQDGGSVRFDGQAVDALPAHKRGVAMVFQDARLFPHMSVGDNVAFPLKARGVAKAARRAEAAEWLARVQLAGFADRRVQELSGGQKQRVALARALAAHPRALLLDEPFSGLDEALRDAMRQLVRSLHEQTGVTTLMVTHDAMEALVMSDTVAYVHEGGLAQVGAPVDLLLHPAAPCVAESFGGARALEGTVRADAFSRGRLQVPAPGVADGPAVLVRTAAGSVAVHAVEGGGAHAAL